MEKITTAEQKEAVEKYLNEVKMKSDLERTDLAKEKTGVFTGAYAINPASGEKMPIWIADYVLATTEQVQSWRFQLMMNVTMSLRRNSTCQSLKLCRRRCFERSLYWRWGTRQFRFP